MKTFKIFNEESIVEFRGKESYILISIRSPKIDKVELFNDPFCRDVLYLDFCDLDKSYKDYKIFTVDNAKQILDFIKQYINISFVAINCEAGISRSAGVGAALNKIYNGDDEYFFKNYIPNKLVYSTILKAHYDSKLPEATWYD